MTSPTPGSNVTLSATNGMTLAVNQLAKVLYNAGFGDAIYGGITQAETILGATGHTLNEIATAIALAESGGVTNVSHKNSNGTTDFGIMQINSVHSDLLSTGNWWDPNANAKMAFTLWQSVGGKFTPWSTFSSGAWMLHLATAQEGVKNRDNSTPIVSAGTTGGVDTNVGGAIADPLASIGNLLGKITNPKTWASVGLIVLGGAILLVVTFKLVSENKTVQKTAGTVAKVAAL